MNPALPLIAVGLLLLVSAFGKKGTATALGSTDIRATLRALASKYGAAIAQNVERIYRLETRNFQSGQFLKTNTAGMAALDDAFPFGWPVRGTTPDMYNPPVFMVENNPTTGQPTGNGVKFVAFKRFPDAAEYLAKFLKDHGNNAGRWHADNAHPDRQAAYIAALSNIEPTFTKDL